MEPRNFFHLLESARVQLFRVRGNDEEEEGRVNATRDDKLEHHRSLHVGESLVLLW